jgi:hypothetical protein
MRAAARPLRVRRARVARPARGSRRVQTWLHGVLWPLHESLSRALGHLTRGDATWRPGAARLEGLHEAAACLGGAGRTNLDDLLAHDGAHLRPALERHATAIGVLLTASAEAQRTYEALVRQVAARDRHTRDPDDGDVAAVAAALVNATIDLSSGPGLLDRLQRDLPALRAARPPALDAACRDALVATDALLAEIEALRRTLCDTYDLAPAPVAVHNGR